MHTGYKKYFLNKQIIIKKPDELQPNEMDLINQGFFI